MEKLFLLMVMFATCFAAPKDMSGKVFVFPKETDTDYVKLVTSRTSFSAATVCLRFITDVSRDYSLFSLATPSASNAFLLFKVQKMGALEFSIGGSGMNFHQQSLSPSTWHSMCATWSAVSGLGQLWVDGKAGVRRFIKAEAISGGPFTILGQEQDSYGGTFDDTQSFVGMMTRVHMWDQVLPSAQIKRYMSNQYITPGNVFNWGALEYEVRGQVLVEDESEVTMS